MADTIWIDNFELMVSQWISRDYDFRKYQKILQSNHGYECIVIKYETSRAQVSFKKVKQLKWDHFYTKLKWLCAILAHSQNPQQPATLVETYLQISLMVTDIQNISHFLWNLQKFAFFIPGAVSVPIFGGPLDLWLQDLWSHYRV